MHPERVSNPSRSHQPGKLQGYTRRCNTFSEKSLRMCVAPLSTVVCVKLDPPPTDVQYREWDKTATRPLTQAEIGTHSAHIRARCARLSKLWTPERTLRM